MDKKFERQATNNHADLPFSRLPFSEESLTPRVNPSEANSAQTDQVQFDLSPLDEVIPISLEDFEFYVDEDGLSYSTSDTRESVLPSAARDGGSPDDGALNSADAGGEITGYEESDLADQTEEELTAAQRYADKSFDELTEEERTELFDEMFGSFLDQVREASQAGVMVCAADFLSSETVPPHFTQDYAASGINDYLSDAELATELEYDDITVLTGTSGIYYYSTKYMADNWARGLFLAAEDDDLTTFATIVRYESEVYPRPLIDFTLINPPYDMTYERIEAAFARAQETPGFDDLQEVSASNKDHYYYSTQFLSPAQAQALAEFYSVEQVRNV